MWDQIAAIQPVRPASLSTPPVPRLRGAAVGPLAGSSGTSTLAGGVRDGDALAPIVPPAEAPAMPIPRLRPEPTVVDRKPLIRLSPGVRNIAEDFAGGVANINSGAPPLAAFGAGFGGAIAADRNREASEAAAALKAEDRALAADDRSYERGRDAVADQRAKDELDAKIKGGYFTKDNDPNKYVDTDGTLTAEGVKTVWGFVSDETDSLRDFYQQSGLIRRSNATEIEAKINAHVTKYREDLENAIRQGKSPFEVPRPVDTAAKEEAATATPGGAPAPAAPAAPAPVAPAAPKPGGEAVAVPPAGYTGAGTTESPYAGGEAPPPGMTKGQVWTDGTYLYEQE